MKNDTYQAAADIINQVATALRKEDFHFIVESTRKFLVSVFDLPPCEDIDVFRLSIGWSEEFANTLLHGDCPLNSAEQRAIKWESRWKRTEVEADLLVAITIREIAKHCRARLGIPEQLGEDTLVDSVLGVDIHLVGSKAYTVHTICGEQKIVPLNLDEFQNKHRPNMNVKIPNTATTELEDTSIKMELPLKSEQIEFALP